MSEQQTQAASSPAETQDPFNGLEPTHQEFSDWRETGKLGERFKPAESAGTAPTDDQEKTGSEAQTESAGESETPNPEANQEQTRKPKNAAQRIAQLEAAIEAEWDKDAPDVVRIGQLSATIDKINGRPKRRTEPATPEPTKTEPTQNQPAANFKEWFDKFDEQKWITEEAAANPNLSYERLNAKMNIHVAEMRDQFQRAQQAEQQALNVVRQKLEDARARYEDADETILPTAGAIHVAQMPPLIKELIETSDNYVDICYVIGSDPDELNKLATLARTDPRAAAAKVFEYERGIKEALGKDGGTAPEKKKTQAPPPPSPVSGTSGRSFDVNDDSISDDEWMRKRRAQVAAK